jgi:hypothetical protein
LEFANILSDDAIPLFCKGVWQLIQLQMFFFLMLSLMFFPVPKRKFDG